MSLFGKLKKIRLSHHLKKNVKKGLIYGKNCVFCDRTNFGSEPYLISIGDNVRITEGVKFITHDGGTWVLNNLDHKNLDVFGRIVIGNNVHIGVNSIIMPGVVIGDNVWIGEGSVIQAGVTIGYGSIIGANSVVTKNVPPMSLVGGQPARVIKEYDKKMGKWMYTSI